MDASEELLELEFQAQPSKIGVAGPHAVQISDLQSQILSLQDELASSSQQQELLQVAFPLALCNSNIGSISTTN